MRKFSKLIKPLLCLSACVALLITFPCLAFAERAEERVEERTLLTVWQVDGFEGGKGSRADFLQRAGNEFTQTEGCIVNVISLSDEAVRLNLARGNYPDVLSYGAGIYGIESCIENYVCWCHGGYCFLTLDGDFGDINAENTVINAGKNNLAGAVALLYGIDNAAFEKSTGAYVKLINGEYKYLLGTQRDIYRLKTRGVSFAVKPVTEFNDLFQNISAVNKSPKRETAEKFISFLKSKASDVSAIGMISDRVVYDDEMKELTGLNYDLKLTYPVSEATHKQLENIISSRDINMLKNLLK